MELIVLAEDCRTLFTRQFEDSYAAAIQASVDDGRTTYDAELAAACVDNLLDAVEATPPECSAIFAIIEDCKVALGGLLGVGGPCTHSYDCDRALRCDSSSTCPGTCVALGSEGQPCTTNQECDSTQNLYCRAVEGDAGPVSTCTAYLPVGAACSYSGPSCEVGAFCLGDICRRIADAFTANETFPCFQGGTLCREGLSCEFSGLPFLSSATCMNERSSLDVCKIALPDECPDGHYCSANALNGGGQCLALPIASQPCANAFMQTIGIAPRCAAGLACVEGLCKPKKRLGEACEADQQCYGGSCPIEEGGTTGVCAPPICSP
jgi:hypothetical protein